MLFYSDILYAVYVFSDIEPFSQCKIVSIKCLGSERKTSYVRETQQNTDRTFMPEGLVPSTNLFR